MILDLLVEILCFSVFVLDVSVMVLGGCASSGGGSICCCGG